MGQRRNRPAAIMPDDAELYRALFDASSYAVLVLAANQVVASSPAALSLFGYRRPEELVGCHPSELSPSKQPDGSDSRSQAALHIRQALRYGQHQFEWLHQHADGRGILCDVTLSRLDFEHGPLLRANVRDITQERERESHLRRQATELEAQLAKQNQKLEAANRDLTREISTLKEMEKALSDQQAFFSQLFHASPEGIVLLDSQDHILQANQAWLDMFDYENDQVIGETINDLIVPESMHEQGSSLSDQVLSGQPVNAESRRLRRDGTLLDMSILGAPVMIDENQIGVFGIYRDVTRQRQAEESYRLAYQALQNTVEGVIILDKDRRVVFVNEAFARITGQGRDAVMGERIHLCSDHKGQAMTEAPIWEALSVGGYWEGEIWNRRQSGDVYPALLSVSAVKDSEGEAGHFVCVFNDISQKKEYESQLERLAHYDPLTGLPNRSLFQQECTHALERAKRRGTLVGLIFLDLDHFKMVNDSLGHPIGDQFLIAIARRLEEQLKDNDMLARLGGDEFAILTEGRPDMEALAELSGRLLSELSEPVWVEGHELVSSCSIGISAFPNDGDDADTLLRNADTAMYRAKAKGRNATQFFSAEMNARAYEDLLMSKALRDALERDQFILHYQPCVSLVDNRMTGVEALVRWHHPEQGVIPPSTFIPLAERNGLIGQLGHWVFREACEQTARWRMAGLPPVRVAINVSARQFNRRGLIQEIAKLIADNGLTPRDLHMEITESMMMENPERAQEVLRSVAEMGMDIAVDDFGTGHSSLSYLKDFPIHYLKIDRSFVMGLPEDQGALAIVKAILAMAHNLNLKVIAEGVETAAQRDILAELGCDEAQGYFFSRPRRASELTRLLEANQALPVKSH
ncbi:diguanylate cyclase (GGDEF)-like protein/PAS domain S-box-containing protein [Natronospira proteinivora]|uniref:Diguanylate cyclase (GGDEF)-like protein/PAS domain S-box-containing protein n=1 Tax=Natronospira proteinivora TaxID=1807133 RepID=A0ABT1GAK1_9GAMM|nr:EAL domain-containing protein [Natronospira proteinivora]MCP1727338.1 diguanylate cyclase (GGDEF)-like protein/PAS domain S-box-containing protein [Natronospira proteinivora]